MLELVRAIEKYNDRRDHYDPYYRLDQDNEPPVREYQSMQDHVGNVYCSHNCTCMKNKLVACSNYIGKAV